MRANTHSRSAIFVLTLLPWFVFVCVCVHVYVVVGEGQEADKLHARASVII